MKLKGSVILLFFYPLIISIFFEAVVIGYFEPLGGYLENLLFASFFLSCVFLLHNPLVKNTLLVLGYLLVSITNYIEVSYIHIYGGMVHDLTMNVIFETYWSEVAEFLPVYTDETLLAYWLLLLIPGAFFIFWILKVGHGASLFTGLKRWKRGVIGLGLVLVLALFFKQYSLSKYNLPYKVYKGYVQYRGEAAKFEHFKFNHSKGNFSGVARLSESEDRKELYVILIGESTTRGHMGVYGYSRNTSPKLNALKEELLVYEDVISPHVHTIASLTKVLTLGNYEQPEAKSKGTVLQLMNMAGFKTYWVSNQQPVGMFETLVTKVAKAADKTVFVNPNYNGKGQPYDGIILPAVESILKEEVDKKVVFIHLLGTHSDYERRFPPEFAEYQDTPKTNFHSEEAFETINNYDNAVKYNDHIVNEIIQMVKKQEMKSYLMYFSDHGEDVYETVNRACHTYKIASKPMYEIPFVLWLSEKYKKNMPGHLVFDVGRRYMTDDLIYSIADLSGVKFNGVERNRSIFNKDFKVRPRMIGFERDFDDSSYNQ